ncbi:XAC2610-related protein [Massilia luteola]|uniref:XAC2610-related protein n=1 Tax=Massilia luteola TaxID=3081751 RepID=UPI002ACC28A5|nr:hypothetical protein [Massilia sp. Gc5]
MKAPRYMVKRVLAGLAGLVPLAALAAGPACDAHAGFAWRPADAGAPASGSVHVVDTRTGRTVQVLDGVQNYYGNDDGLFAQDLNNDGCPDLVVTTEVAPIGNRTSTIYLYDRASGRFVFSEALSAIGDINVDSRDPNCLTGDWKGGADDVGGERYCWRKGKLVKTNDYSVRPMYDKKTGTFSCFEHSETTHAGGRKRERRDCTKRF